ncbi:polysaccharide deacetylase family protein [Mycobacterium nebraskense]|uniref:Polysaccharide deacetylase n=1 Tax=Mycobacterium nebraskense TaxID=244292 RepID=A0A0F5NE58_9MYCO|nr:polysaccharide deacetylase family protein [Mycobacterium nebraskense]KKC04553.1 polysaccharide deacetylase [Mycobacterium nebraskense]KLO35576.1 polysaccharide deacetylase [Mycobacterium nebraskense]MBI2693197.1 polysaccharide deacetylase family protein [Mycobacterium nebraskense]MCV7116973.1 polysaccharide deacetylase family protein [Mycobacterium nebraskense]ORW15843.1 polysaccharide deacetylase [Mycobacterium nebraskense]
MSRVKDIVATLLCVAGVPAFARRRHRDTLAIVMFHGVEDEPLSPVCRHVHGSVLYRRELEYVRRHFNILPLEEALDRLAEGTLPPRAMAITFDDGTRNLATHAVPVLRELGLPAAVFLATGPMGSGETLWPDRLWLAIARTAAAEVDLAALGLGTRSLDGIANRAKAYAAAVEGLKDLADADRITVLDEVLGALGHRDGGDVGPFRMLSWDEARGMAGDGLVTLHPHSVTHPILARCGDDKVEREIADSCAALERETGCAATIFAYPNGRPQDFDTRAKDVLRGRGIRWALSTTAGLADRRCDPLALPRLAVASDASFDHFRLMVSGGLPRRYRGRRG